MKRNGFYSNKRQRWCCKSCNRSFHWDNPKNKLNHERIWFERWIVEGYSVRQLQQLCKHSSSKLYEIIDYWLNRPPREEDGSFDRHKHTLFDATFLHRPECIVVMMDADKNMVIKGEYGVRENSEPQLMSFFDALKQKGFNPFSCTVDGNPQAIRSLRKAWPKITIQRCLVHIQRQGIRWCRQHPKRTDAKRLREIFSLVPIIHSAQEREQFLKTVDQWEQRYGKRIAGQPEKGRVFSDIKRARSMLLNAIPNMFHYLSDPGIPKTTNALEGYFSRMKKHYRNHAGLTEHKLKNYFEWYFSLKPK